MGKPYLFGGLFLPEADLAVHLSISACNSHFGMSLRRGVIFGLSFRRTLSNRFRQNTHISKVTTPPNWLDSDLLNYL